MAGWSNGAVKGDKLTKAGKVTASTSTSSSQAPNIGDPYSVTPPTVYDTNLPTWSLSARQNQTAAASFSQAVDQGYDVVATRGSQARHDFALAYANGSLSDSATKYPFFVTDVNIDWTIAGKMAQSRLTRDMYPHNMVQPAFVIKGVSRDQQDYAELMEYIHQTQHDALNGGKLIQLSVMPGQIPSGTRPAVIHGQPTRGVRIQSKEAAVGNANAANQIIRGDHDPIIAQGYVKSVVRKHSKGNYFPFWELEFIVAAMLQGPYAENLVTVQKQKNWVDVVKSVSLFDTSWYVANDKQNLDWVKQRSENVFHYDAPAPLNQGSGSSGSGSGGGSNTGGASGIQWKVIASAEDDPVGASGSCQSIQADGYSELSTDPTAPLSALDFAGLGHIPCLTRMIITNPQNGNSTTTVKQDVGAGSTFNGPSSGYPVMGLYPSTRAKLGLTGGNPYTVLIQRADGVALKPARGTQIGSATSGASTKGKSFDQLNETGVASWSGHGGYQQSAVTMCKWIINELNWAIDNGWKPATPITSGYRPGRDSHTATGQSNHQGTSFNNGQLPCGAIDFGGYDTSVGKATKQALVNLTTQKNYPGPRLMMPIGFHDDGHVSGNGS